jgi:hypothetical protein
MVPTVGVTYGAIFSLYGRMTWFKHGSSRQDVGASLTLRRETAAPVDPTKPPSLLDSVRSALDFPLGFYVERRGISGRGKPDTKTGAVIVFKFP